MRKSIRIAGVLLLALVWYFGSKHFHTPQVEIQVSSAGAEGDATSDSIGPRVIYGEDDRLDLYEIADAGWLELVDSTLAVLDAASLSESSPGQTQIKGYKFGDYMNLCPTERFRDQETAAFCSAFLVAPQVVATAGHCVRTAAQCKKTKFVFGFAIRAAGELPRSVASSEVYDCRQILKNEVDSSGADFALIELNRPVTNHRPLKLNAKNTLTPESPLTVVGHPAGLPLKLAGGATVRRIEKAYFVANLDTYGGNSGSAVFNSKTGEVEGILVRGETDFTVKDGCRVSNVCPEAGCRGEDVTSIQVVIPHIPPQGRQPAAE